VIGDASSPVQGNALGAAGDRGAVALLTVPPSSRATATSLTAEIVPLLLTVAVAPLA
jgi:hypothetical protein